ncbi:hypothetical protein NBRC13296_06710 [Paenibacillus chitinolyticus]|uniref:hypothetical protein n=1 Tax=Paenibacillus chitinolyticus TaxID=79263 RepID=UPI00355701C2
MSFIICAYKNKQDVMAINPTAKDSIGAGSSTNQIFLLEPEYQNEEIGQKLKEAFEFCTKEPFLNERIAGNLPELLGYSSRSKFVKEHVQVIISVRSDLEKVLFTPMKREGNGYMNNGSTKIELAITATNEQLGQGLLDAFNL